MALLPVVVVPGGAQKPDLSRTSRENLLFTTVSIDDSGEQRMVLDTGASSTALVNERLGRKLRLQRQNPVRLGGAGSSDCRAALTAAVPLRISGKELGPARLALIDLAHLERFLGMPVEGVVGGELFRDYAVALDYASSRAEALSGVESAGFSAMPLEASGGLCCIVAIRLSIAGRELPGRFLIDTGAPAVDLVLGSRFAEKHRLMPAATGEPIRLPGLCATSSLLPLGRAADVHMANSTVREVSVLVSQDRAGALAEEAFDGILGGGFLRRFAEVVIDGPGARLLFKIRQPER